VKQLHAEALKVRGGGANFFFAIAVWRKWVDLLRSDGAVAADEMRGSENLMATGYCRLTL
jgi:hypothetical protein